LVLHCTVRVVLVQLHLLHVVQIKLVVVHVESSAVGMRVN
jgi:hypothetical protein